MIERVRKSERGQTGAESVPAVGPERGRTGAESVPAVGPERGRTGAESVPAVSPERGQTTAEYALVILGAAAVALLVLAWATDTGMVSTLLNKVIRSVADQVT